MKLNYQTKHGNRGFTLVELLVVIVIIASLAGLSAPMVIRQVKKADQTEAVSNARQIGLAMFEFSNDYSTYPGARTQTLLTTNFPAADVDVTGDTTGSNGYFRQLFHAGIASSEDIFYAKIKGTIKPDGNASSSTEALKKGEVGFGYILDGTEGMSTAGNPSRPILATPFDTKTTFAGDPFDKKAVFLRIDNSVTSLTISTGGSENNTGKVNIGGADIMSESNEIWGSTSPDAILPDL